ncbi:MAG: DUF63 family protein [Candidatus Methanoperedens sp.]|nr:DUF63 family protein [Candidatus Methanoperedens sp.]
MSIIDSVWHYIDKYYISGIVYDTSYNIVDTLTYAIVLGISLFWVLKLLGKLDVNIDTRFLIAITTYVIAGSSLRVLEDSQFFTPPLQYLFVTPLIYFFMFGVTISILSVTIYLERKGKIKDHNTFFGYAGAFWAFFNIAALIVYDGIANPVPGAAILFIGITMTGIVYIISQKLNFLLLTDKVNISILFAHILDASSTFIGMDWLNYYEKHVVPTFFIDLAGKFISHPSIVMIPLKLIVFIPVLYVLDNDFKTEKEKKLVGLMKLTILVLGLSPAVRNTLRIMMGV